MKTPLLMSLTALGCLAIIMVITFTGYGDFQREQQKNASGNELKDWTRHLGYRVDEWEGDARMKLAMASYLLTPEPSENQPAAAINPVRSEAIRQTAPASVQAAEIVAPTNQNSLLNPPLPASLLLTPSRPIFSQMTTSAASAPSLFRATFVPLPALNAGAGWSPVYRGMRSSHPAKSQNVIARIVSRMFGH